MLAILKNDLYRLWEEKAYLFVSMFLTICAVTAAIVLTNNVQVKGNIAVVSKDKNIEFADCKYFNITVLNSAPKKSELVQNRYDAVVTIDNGNYKIFTIKNNDLEMMIKSALQNPKKFTSPMDTERKTGTNIIGYMMMFLLMQGVLYARLFSEDKEKHMIERVLVSPIAFRNYLLGHAIFIMSIILIPSFIVIAGAKIISANIGFSLMQYAGLLLVLSMLSTAFSLFLCSLFNGADTTNMIGSAFLVLTSILAGSFYSFSKNRVIFNKILHILPQKDFINYADALEKGNISINTNLQFTYVIALTAALFVFSILKTRKDYIYHK